MREYDRSFERLYLSSISCFNIDRLWSYLAEVGILSLEHAVTTQTNGTDGKSKRWVYAQA